MTLVIESETMFFNHDIKAVYRKEKEKSDEHLGE